MDNCKEIKQTFWTKKSLKTEVFGKEIKKIFLNRNDELLPTYWYGSHYTKSKNVKIEEDSPILFMKALLDDTTINGFMQNTQYGFTNSDRKKREFIFDISFGGTPKTFYTFSFSISHEYFTCIERIIKFLNIGKQIIELINPIYGKIHDIGDSVETRKRGQTLDVYNKIPRVYWGNFINNEYIQKIGDKKLESFEAYKNEIIANGRFIQLTESPFDFNTKDFKEKQKKLEKIIGKKFLGYKEAKLPFKL